MILAEGKLKNGVLTIQLSGRIDSLNVSELKRQNEEVRRTYPTESIVLDCEKLEFTTSSGLRLMLNLKKEVHDTRIINAQPAVYDVLDMTGFTELFDVQKAYRVLSVEGCEIIGQGANGKVYRIDRDTIVKVYRNPDSLPEIHRERELARTAFIAGVPTAIPYDVVRIESGGYGSVFELLNATGLAALLIQKEKTVDEAAAMSIDLLKLIHSKTAKPNTMPDMKETALGWVDFLKDYLLPEQYEKLYTLIRSVPDDMHMMHGDFHIKNIMLQNGEVLLIDMDTLCHGHPIFELAGMYNAYCGYGILDHTITEKFLGIPFEIASAFWRRSLELYLGTMDEEKIRSTENKARLIGSVRMMRRIIRRNRMGTEEGRANFEYNRNVLDELLGSLDTLEI